MPTHTHDTYTLTTHTHTHKQYTYTHTYTHNYSCVRIPQYAHALTIMYNARYGARESEYIHAAANGFE